MTWAGVICLAALLGCDQPATAQPERIVLMRHAEKPDDPGDPHLSPAGKKRAQKISQWLETNYYSATNRDNLVLFAAEPTRRGRSLRCEETLTPFSKLSGLPINTPCAAADYATLAHRLQTDASLRGKTVVICWVHEYMPEFAAALGVRPRPDKWKGEDYDSAYLIQFRDGKAVLEKIREHIKPK